MSSEQGECHRRECHNEGVFLVRERYQEETGNGVVEATARLCQTHASDESPTNLDPVTPEYLFEVTTLTPERGGTDTEELDENDDRFVQCPDCGWTGAASEVAIEDGDRRCPACSDDIEIVE